MQAFLTFLALLIGMTASAPDIAADEAASDKFSIQGQTLVYDTVQVGPDGDITNDDIDAMLAQLTENPGITTLELNSEGGSVYAGFEMARIVIDFELDTIVSGECFSSCVSIFLGGNKRQMMLGSKIGFHQTAWAPSATQEYYEERRDGKGWETPFDFASWLYEDTQTEVYEELMYMIDRGVDAAFAIRTKGVRNSDNWYPSRVELVQAGVLRD